LFLLASINSTRHPVTSVLPLSREANARETIPIPEASSFSRSLAYRDNVHARGLLSRRYDAGVRRESTKVCGDLIHAARYFNAVVRRSARPAGSFISSRATGSITRRRAISLKRRRRNRRMPPDSTGVTPAPAPPPRARRRVGGPRPAGNWFRLRDSSSGKCVPPRPCPPPPYTRSCRLFLAQSRLPTLVADGPGVYKRRYYERAPSLRILSIHSPIER